MARNIELKRSRQQKAIHVNILLYKNKFISIGTPVDYDKLFLFIKIRFVSVFFYVNARVRRGTSNSHGSFKWLARAKFIFLLCVLCHRLYSRRHWGTIIIFRQFAAFCHCPYRDADVHPCHYHRHCHDSIDPNDWKTWQIGSVIYHFHFGLETTTGFTAAKSRAARAFSRENFHYWYCPTLNQWNKIKYKIKSRHRIIKTKCRCRSADHQWAE